MFNHSIKTTIGVIKYHVKELLGLADTALVKKWAFFTRAGPTGHEEEELLAAGTRSCFYCDT
ncbi:MAG: hypothetical protein PUP93_14420 [Rhizonema sp. NSF051]|nr:hypothetical protein [Rhizonema sp. NSF051]